MTLTRRLALTLLLAIVLSVVATSAVTFRAAVRPVADEIHLVMRHLAVQVAHRSDAGTPNAELEAALHLRVEPLATAPAAWSDAVLDGRRLKIPEQLGRGVAVETDEGWLLVRRREIPVRSGLLAAAFAVLVVVLAFASLSIARRVLGPLYAVDGALERVAAGELEHRLPTEGPPELRRLATTFNRMADQVSALLEAEKQTLATISHDLRTPLTRLRLQVELMRRDGADPGRLDRIERDAGVLDTLIEEALQISRLRANDPQLVREPLDLADLARDALREYDHPVDAQLSSVVLFGDRKLLLRALRNVLANVERHALSDRPLRVRCDAGCIEFRDHGPGIADHEMDRVFEPYVRATGDPGGSGLGLSIVHRVMELHGGTVTLENHDRGLSVRLDFPQSHV